MFEGATEKQRPVLLHRALRTTVTLSTLVFAAQLVMRSRHIRFVFDDFEFAAAVDRLGIVGYMREMYWGFSGRTALVLAGGTLSSLGQRWAGIISALMIVLLLLSWARVASQLTETRRASNVCVVPPLVLALWTLPAPGQALYWLIGSLVYLAPMALVLIGGVWIGWHHSLNRVVSFAAACVAALLVYVGSGGNETLAGVTPVSLVLCALLTSNHRVRTRALLLVPWSIAGGLTLVFAPGQRARARWVPAPDDYSPAETASQCVSAIMDLLIERQVVLAMSVFLGVVSMLAGARGFRRLVFPSLIVAAAGWAGLTVVAAFGSKAVPPARATTAAYVLTVMAAWCVGGRIAEVLAAPSSTHVRTGRVSTGRVSTGRVSTGRMTSSSFVNVSVAVAALSLAVVGVPRSWSIDQSERRVADQLDCVERSINQQIANRETEIVIDAPETVNDIWFALPSSDKWPNRRMAEYYGVDRIANDQASAPTKCT